MQTQMLPERFPNRSQWGNGPWETEVDVATWTHKGVACAIIRAGMGHLCGYIRIPEGHPLHGLSSSSYYDESSTLNDATHCGVTYAEAGLNWNDSLKQYEYGDGGWWVGFDCGHHSDLSPELKLMLSHSPALNIYGNYRTFDYVQKRVEKMATALLKWKAVVAGVPEQAEVA